MNHSSFETTAPIVPRHSELILGGQKSGKSRRAEHIASAWLARSDAHHALLIATARPLDEEMRMRIARHQRERALRVPRMATLEEPLDVAASLARYSAAHTLIVVDCLTLWLTGWLACHSTPMEDALPGWHAQQTQFFAALHACPGPVVLVGNEIGMGIIPLGAQVRAFADALGQLNQCAAAACQRVTLMVAGLALNLKEQ